MDSYCCNVSSLPDPSPTLKSAFPKVFSEELGLCSKTKVKLELKEKCRPVFCPKRPVAYAMIEAIDLKLNRLQQLNIITPIDYSEWAAPIVVVRKANGSIRICGDYSTGLNAALQPHQFPLSLPEDIFAKLVNCKVFSQIDLSDAFLQVVVDEKDHHLLTINTHLGLYFYNRLATGVKNAPGAFQQITTTMLAGIPGCPAFSMTSSSAVQPKRNTTATWQPSCSASKTTALRFVLRNARSGRPKSATWGTSSTAAGCDPILLRSRPLPTCRHLLTCLVFDPSSAQLIITGSLCLTCGCCATRSTSC